MKQKVVIKVSLKDQKTCKKVITTAVGVDGVSKADLVHEKNQIEVTGDGIDVVLLAKRLRKAMKHAEIESVSMIDDKTKEKKEEPVANYQTWPYQFNTPMTVHGFVDDHSYAIHNQDSPSCSIM